MRFSPGGWRNLDGLALVTPAGEIPDIGKARALNRLDGLDPADVYPFEKEAFSVRLIDDGEACAVGVEPGASCDEVLFVHSEVGCYCGHFLGGDVDVSRPATAVAAPHALVIGAGCRRGKCVKFSVF